MVIKAPRAAPHHQRPYLHARSRVSASSTRSPHRGEEEGKERHAIGLVVAKEEGWERGEEEGRGEFGEARKEGEGEERRR